jgi:hypothetical protein
MLKEGSGRSNAMRMRPDKKILGTNVRRRLQNFLAGLALILAPLRCSPAFAAKALRVKTKPAKL